MVKSLRKFTIILQTANQLAARSSEKTNEWGSEYASTKLLSGELRMPHDILRRYSNIYELYDDILA